MPLSLEQKKRNRFLFLKLMYEEFNGSESAIFRSWDVGKQLNFDRAETSNIVDYLIGEYLIDARALGGAVGLTHAGIVEVEEALQHPDRSTEHFLPVNIINIGNMTNSTLQQGTDNSTINFHIDQSGLKDLGAMLSSLDEIKGALNLSVEQQQELLSEMQTLESQRNSPKPKKIIIRESLKTVRALLESVAGNAATPAIVNMISSLLR